MAVSRLTTATSAAPSTGRSAARPSGVSRPERRPSKWTSPPKASVTGESGVNGAELVGAGRGLATGAGAAVEVPAVVPVTTDVAGAG